MHKEPYAVLFDMDGVLVDTYRAHYLSWLEMGKPEGVQFTEAEFAYGFGRTSREIIAHFFGRDRYDDAQIAALDDRKEAAFRRLIDTELTIIPGAVELLRSLRAAGFAIAVGSSAPMANVEKTLDIMGVRDWFGAVTSGSDVRCGKPDPAVYLLAAERLGVPPGRCAVVEDAPAGVEAAHAAGMVCVGLLSTGRTPEDLADAERIVHSHAELSPDIFRRLIDRE
jgi:beta-phosphoglucomutase